MFQPDIWPFASHFLSAMVALLPLLTVFLLLGVLRIKAHWSGLAGLGVAILVAIFAYKMPVAMALSSGLEGIMFALFPILWIVLTAVWFYELTVVSGRAEDLRGALYMVSDDPRILAVLIAFGFGSLLEALAGFGAPVAITGVMLIAVGFPPIKAALAVLIANTAPVAFGAVATPIITAGNLTGIPYQEVGLFVGRQTSMIAWMVPMLMILVADGWRGVKETLPCTLPVGIAFAATKWISSTWISVELTDVFAALAALGVGVAILRFWKPKGTAEAQERLRAGRDAEVANGWGKDLAPAGELRHPNGKQIWMALFPYVLVMVVFILAKLVGPIKDLLAKTDITIQWPGLYGKVLTSTGQPNKSTIYTLTTLSSPGTLLLLCGLIVAVVFKISMGEAFKTMGRQIYKMRWTVLTVCSVLALAYVMNMSGQTYTVGVWIASVGSVFAYFSAVLGWIGTAVTGSDTSANALFATLQQTVANELGLDPRLLIGANTAGGVVGKMISPQNLAIAATATGLVGRESEILRKAVWWSLGLLIFLCLIVGLQSTPVLGWMVPAIGVPR